jgi:hypothetical protein
MISPNRNQLLAAALLAAFLAVGCQSQPSAPINHGEEFYADGAPRSVNEFCDAEAANGARADATLYPCHFDGAVLNSLGQKKLDLMLHADNASGSLTVYFSFSDNTYTAARKDAVLAYLKTYGLKDDAIALKDGPNPDSKASAAENIDALTKIDTSSAADSGATSSK